MPPKYRLSGSPGVSSGGGSPIRQPVTWEGPKGIDEELPKPRAPGKRALGNEVVEKLRGLKVSWVEVVAKVCKAGLSKQERYMLVMEHFLAFAHFDGTVHQISCLADLTRVFYTEGGRRFYVETKDSLKGFLWEPLPNHPFNSQHVKQPYSPWSALLAVNNARSVFKAKPLRVLKTASTHHSMKSRCVPVLRPSLDSNMDFEIIHVKRTSNDATSPIGVVLQNQIIVHIAESTPAHEAGMAQYIGRRVLMVNGEEITRGVENIESRNKKTAIVVDSTRLAAPEVAITLPCLVEVDRKSLSSSFGLRFTNTLTLHDVSKKIANPLMIKRLQGLTLTHVDGVGVADMNELQRLTSKTLFSRFTFDSPNTVTIHLPEGSDYTHSGLSLSPSLEVVAVKRGSPAFQPCFPFSKGYRVLKANGFVVRTLGELQESLEGYLTFRLFFGSTADPTLLA
eukprot:TRINITY_DN5014_c1_g1_i1.p1 TRINITY_DN5014_c1_g1~~TRINITY_DN5014_c1_g1_i1.p1  ORF type:complete len:470 (+),score=41.88 TRINITY_DN5014_c1_g1_i1:58-1410(+)